MASVFRRVYETARAAITKHLKLDAVTTDGFFHSSRGWRCKVQVSGRSGSSEASILGL